MLPKFRQQKLLRSNIICDLICDLWFWLCFDFIILYTLFEIFGRSASFAKCLHSNLYFATWCLTSYFRSYDSYSVSLVNNKCNNRYSIQKSKHHSKFGQEFIHCNKSSSLYREQDLTRRLMTKANIYCVLCWMWNVLCWLPLYLWANPAS